MPPVPLELYRNVKLEAPAGVKTVKQLLANARRIQGLSNLDLSRPSPPPVESVTSLVEKGSGVLFDVSRQMGSAPLEFEESDGGIDMFSFTIKHGAAAWIEFTRVGHRARMEAGYLYDKALDPRTAADVASLGMVSATKRLFLDGVVSAIRPLFPDNGKPELGITVESDLFLLTRNKPGQISYPNAEDSASTLQHLRTFHLGKPTIRMSEIVRGIVEEYRIPVRQVLIESQYDFVFDNAHRVTQQADESDFDFILRLLTGRTRAAAPGRRTIGTNPEAVEDPTVNGHARMWMEFDPLLGRSAFRVAPERHLVEDVSDTLSFRYHIPGQQLVSPFDYNPVAQKTELVISNVGLADNPDTARGKETQVVKDVSTNPEVGDAGEQQADEYTDIEEGWDVNEDLVRKDYEDGLLDEKALSEYRRGRIGRQYLKRYVINKRTVHQPSGKPTGNNPDANKVAPGGAPAPPSTDGTPALGSGSGGEGAPGVANSPKRPKGPKVRRFGQTLTFEARGNIFMESRRSYQVHMGVARYSGSWYAMRVRHTFGPTYRMQVEMGN